MSILLAGLLLSLWGVMIYAAPKRKRYRRWTRVGDPSIDGEENDTTATTVGDLGVFGHDAGGHGAGHHGAHDIGSGHDFSGHVGGDCGSGGDFGGGDVGGGDCGGGSD